MYSPTTAERTDRDLERYHDVLSKSLPKFSVGEVCLLCDVCNGWFATIADYCCIWMEVEDGIESNGLDEKWGVDGLSLIERLKALSPTENLAVIDAIERWFDCVAHDDYETSFREVGLVK